MSIAIRRLPAVKERFGVQRTCVYGLVRAGLLTEPIKISARASGWPDAELDAIAGARIAGKSDAEIRALVTELHAARKAAA